MQRIALLVLILGMIFLASYMEFSSSITVNSNKNLSNLLENQRVYVAGTVIKESQTQFTRILVLNNNITLYCDCSSTPKLINKDIQVIGIIDTYQIPKIKVLKIRWH